MKVTILTKLVISNLKLVIFAPKRKAFTLIESLAVIAIIGILLSLGTYIFTQASAQARDAVRKSDLDQVAQAFNARALDKTCATPAAVGLYPGKGLEQTGNQLWLKVGVLANTTTSDDGCGPFTKYLPTLPNDVRSPTYSYYFNLSTTEVSGSQTLSVPAKHYRLTTALEHQFATGSPDQLECVRLSKVWINTFGGQPYDCDQHVITFSRPSWLIPAARAQGGVSCISFDPNGVGYPPGCTGGGGGGPSCPAGESLVNGVCVPNGGGGGGGGGGGTTTPGPYNYYIGQ